jgi:hypothetical protein
VGWFFFFLLFVISAYVQCWGYLFIVRNYEGLSKRFRTESITK